MRVSVTASAVVPATLALAAPSVGHNGTIYVGACGGLAAMKDGG